MNNKQKKVSLKSRNKSFRFYEASEFWRTALVDIEVEFNENGIENFRNSDLSRNFFVPTYGCPGNSFSDEEIENLAAYLSSVPIK